jgi:TRAP-type C4-dicarboxylate transport system substrate-binding protein
MSGGRWNFEMYSAGELMPDDQLFQAVQDGTIDIIYTSAPISAVPIDMYNADWAPPFGWYNPLELLTMWFEKGLGELFVESWEELGGVHVPLTAMTPCDPCNLLSTVPVETYEDLEGLKVNAFRLVAEPFVDAGAISVPAYGGILS